MAIQRRDKRGACGPLGLAHLGLPAAQPPKLCADLGNEANPLLVEELVAFLDQPLLILELELRDPGGDGLVRHALSRDSAQSARASSASARPPARPAEAPSRPPCFHRACAGPAG